MTFKQLPERLQQVPARGQTVLEVSCAPDLKDDLQFNNSVSSAARLAEQFGFHALSLTGEQPLGARGSPAVVVNPSGGAGR